MQKKLDDAHPKPQQSVPDDGRGNEIPAETTRATSLHLDSILHHPLLDAAGPSVAENRQLTTQAILKFDRELKQDSLTLSTLRKYVNQYHLGIKRGETTAGNGIGSLVNAWFNTKDLSTKGYVLTDPKVVSDILPVMYHDGLEENVWDWLRILYQHPWLPTQSPDTVSTMLSQAEDHFVSSMMRAAVQRGYFQDAAQQYIQARTYRQSRDGEKAIFLLSAWRRISYAILARKSKHGVNTSTFDQLLEGNSPVTKVPFVTSAYLQLYHPVHPTYQHLYEALQDQSYVDAWSTWNTYARLNWKKGFLSAYLDAAQLALDQNNARHAEFFLDFAQAHYPDFLPAKHAAQPRDWLAEAREALAQHPTGDPGLVAG